MARRVFFSFHYDRDIWRASVVRNSWVLKENREEAGFWDASLWEEAKRKGDDAIKRMIDRGLENTSVTVILIGKETASRRWVTYEIQESYKRGNGLLGIYIDRIKNQNGDPDERGPNPLSNLQITESGQKVLLSQIYPTYDWVQNNGASGLGSWVEAAARQAGR